MNVQRCYLRIFQEPRLHCAARPRREHYALRILPWGALAASVATLILAISVGPQPFTFLADDYVHLVATYREPQLFLGHFAAWLPRVPVWSGITALLFGSHVLEHGWWPMLAFFLVHSLALASLAAWVARLLPGPERAPPVLWAAAVMVFSFYPNAYEILYWPTCMPYTVGAALLAAGLWARPPALRCGLLALSMLTYETFVLPGLALLLLEAGLSAAPRTRQGRALTQAWLLWAAALGVTALARGIASRWFGSFAHDTRLSPGHILRHMADTLAMLLRFKHAGMHTALLATGAFGGFILLGMLAAKASRRALGWLGAACFASTALFWVLGYGALRSVYGAQLLLCALAINLLHGLWHARPGGRQITAALLALMALGFWLHQRELWQIKQHNQQQLAGREAHLAAALQACVSPCNIPVSNLQVGLRPDWLLPADFVPTYLEYVRLKHAPDKAVSFSLD